MKSERPVSRLYFCSVLLSLQEVLLCYGAHVEGALLGPKMLLCPGFTLEVLRETSMAGGTIWGPRGRVQGMLLYWRWLEVLGIKATPRDGMGGWPRGNLVAMSLSAIQRALYGFMGYYFESEGRKVSITSSSIPRPIVSVVR